MACFKTQRSIGNVTTETERIAVFNKVDLIQLTFVNRVVG